MLEGDKNSHNLHVQYSSIQLSSKFHVIFPHYHILKNVQSEFELRLAIVLVNILSCVDADKKWLGYNNKANPEI